MTSLAPALEGFFTQRLLAQRRASPNTVAAPGHFPAVAALHAGVVGGLPLQAPG